VVLLSPSQVKMLINYFLKEKLDPNKVLHYQNIASLFIGLYTLYTIINPVSVGYYDMTTNTLMVAFAGIDMLFFGKE
jgi:hypothetical protein